MEELTIESIATVLFGAVDNDDTIVVETKVPALSSDGDVVRETLTITHSYSFAFTITHANGTSDYVRKASQVYSLLAKLYNAGLLASIAVKTRGVEEPEMMVAEPA